MALHNSVAIAAAFTRDPRLTDDNISDGTSDDDGYAGSGTSDAGSKGSGGSGSSGSSSLFGGGSFGLGSSGPALEWPEPLLQLGNSLFGARRPLRLVGFARAAGDYSLVSGAGSNWGDERSTSAAR